MTNRPDFTIDAAVLQEAVEALQSIPQKYETAIKAIKEVTNSLIETSNWKGKTRDEFRDTYRIVEHYLDDDQQQMGDIIEILKGFQNIYEAADIDTAKELVDKTGKVVDMLTE